MSSSTTAVNAWEALFRAQVSIMRYLSADFTSDEISFNEYDVLFNLSRQPGRRLRIRDLNQHLLLTQPSVSRLVDRLASRQLVDKTPDPDDARGIVVALTDDGYELFRRVARHHIVSITKRIGTALNDEELQTLTALCDRIRLSAEAR